MESVIPLDSERAAHAVEVAPRLWWVGDVLSHDPFQCHAFLIEAGDQSVLIDPGSSLTIGSTLAKVREIVELDDIATILLHHSDPDIADSLHVLAHTLTRPDVRVVTEWRSALLLHHMAVRFPFVSIEELGWKLDLHDGRVLEFLLTPYLHFPGAFVTYEPSTRSLFSSDLFGGFNRAHRLWAQSADDFEDLRQFHEHYMPSREILMAGLATITAHYPDIECVFPQHGYMIPHHLVHSMFDQLGKLECGMMLVSRSDAHLAELLAMAASVRHIEDILDAGEPLGVMLDAITRELGTLVPLEEFWVEVGHGPSIVRFDVEHTDGCEVESWTHGGDRLAIINLADQRPGRHVAVVFRTVEPWVPTAEAYALLSMLSTRVHHLADEEIRERNARHRERALLAEASADPLTGLLNRRALEHAIHHSDHAAVLMIDIDHFKRVNDTFGHAVGDAVLRAVATALTDCIRRTDTAIRYGGEELLAIVELDEDAPASAAAGAIADRIRDAVRGLDPRALGVDAPVTVSVGAAVLDERTSLFDHLRHADAAMYHAKHQGRDRTVVYDPVLRSVA